MGETLLEVAVSRLRVWAEFPVSSGGPPVHRKDAKRVLDALDAAVQRAEAAERLLRGVQWYEPASNHAPSCPGCEAFKGDGHEEDCPLAAFLAAAPPAAPSEHPQTADRCDECGLRVGLYANHKSGCSLDPLPPAALPPEPLGDPLRDRVLRAVLLWWDKERFGVEPSDELVELGKAARALQEYEKAHGALRFSLVSRASPPPIPGSGQRRGGRGR
jgi:hypothetical protein